MLNFGPLAAEIGSGVWGTPANFNGFRVLAALLHGIVVGVSQTAAFNRGRHLYSAGRPRWVLAHISSYYYKATQQRAAPVRCRCQLVCNGQGAHWRNLANTIEPSVCGDATLCQTRNVGQCPMPNVMAALPNIGGALCSKPQSLTDAHY